MATGWNGRFFNAEVGEGAPIVQVWDGQGLDYEYFVQVKGGPCLLYTSPSPRDS